ncbi:aromatic-ring-hydroxylating dioxygenase subunit beta [Nocardia sienata]|uniref:aromatic-ring-hydroxylating dioxygenase subunit beta n=1 Tax=Nocardia sienata TaxID=248552 RepID=UPI0007A383F6|nr:aromatic-ring-hydroxylating dioxygenase subunit beta [Nocardia sienata]
MTETTERISPSAPVAVTQQLHFEVSQFLYRESALLDADRYEDWLALLTPTVHYRVSARTVRASDQPAEGYPIVDNHAGELRIRVQQISNAKLTYSENPHSITRRFISNVIVERDGDPSELSVTSNTLLFRSHSVDGNQHLYSAIRRDRLLIDGDSFKLAARDVTLDLSVIPSMNVSVLF